MSVQSALSPLFLSLARIYADEPRSGGADAATALQAAALTLPDIAPVAPHELDPELRAALALNPGPLCDEITDALGLITWHHSGLEEGRIRPAMARKMLTTELLGPDGLVFHPTLRVGLFMQSRGLDYATRQHPAEETFVMLAGSGHWSCNHAPHQTRHAGDYIHHPSEVPHVSVTTDQPFVAAWRWSGDIGFEGYRMTA